jgi:hypothetical protein
MAMKNVMRTVAGRPFQVPGILICRRDVFEGSGDSWSDGVMVMSGAGGGARYGQVLRVGLPGDRGQQQEGDRHARQRPGG